MHHNHPEKQEDSNSSRLPLQQIELAADVSLIVHDQWSGNQPCPEWLVVLLGVSKLTLLKTIG